MIAVIDYDAGNLTSVAHAVRRLGGDPTVTRRPEDVKNAERIIFPGVGAAKASMDSLEALGLAEALREARAAGKPILAICIGCQVVFDRSEEDGGADCLGLLPGDVARFEFSDGVQRKIPHMGWNEVKVERDHALFAGVPDGSQFYFVHSYYVRPQSPDAIIASCDYGFSFPAAVGDGSLACVQFHAEKSGPAGLTVLRNFLQWTP